MHQPNFFPRLATLAKLYHADVWIVLDNVQFVRRDYQHRCKLAALDDPTIRQWLTLPVHRPHGQASHIDDITLVDSKRSQKRLDRLLRHYYRRSPYWPLLENRLPSLGPLFYAQAPLATIAEATTRILLDLVGWQGTIRHSAELPHRSGRSQRLADLTAAVGATTYLCGTGGRRYLDTQPFADQDITVHYIERPRHSTATGPWQAPADASALWAIMAFGPQLVAKEIRQPLPDASRPMAETPPPTHRLKWIGSVTPAGEQGGLTGR